MIFNVTKECTLLPFLMESLTGRSRTTVKSYLTHGQVSVNGCATTQYNAPLSPGDTVAISREHGSEPLRHPKLRIVYEDDYLIVVNKSNGLLSMGTDKEQKKTAFYILSEYVKRQDPRNMIFIVHRLDRETSGLMLFAKNTAVQEKLQRGWKDLVTDRRYMALIEGHMSQDEGTIVSHLTEDRNHKVWAAREGEGNPAVTYYTVLKKGGEYSLLDLKLETGRKNQIRAHLEWKGTPIAGDKKYGALTNPVGRVCLHAYKLHLTHPVTGERLEFSTRIPGTFEIGKL